MVENRIKRGKTQIRRIGLDGFILTCFAILSVFVQNSKEGVRYIDTPHIVISFTPLYILLIVCTLCLFMKSLRVGFGSIYLDEVAFLLFLRLCIELISSILNGMPKATDGEIAQSFIVLAVYIYVYNRFDDASEVNSALIMLVCILLAVIGEAVLGRYSFFGDAYLYKHDMYVPIGGSNAIAAIISSLTIFTMCQCSSVAERLSLSFLGLFGIVLTKSRGGLVAFALTALICLLIAIRKKRVNLLAMACLVVLTIIVYTSILPGLQMAFSSSTHSVYSRIELLKAGFDRFAESPIFGIGFDDYLRDNNPHNFLLSIVLRTGLVGLALFISLVCVVIAKARRHISEPLVLGSLLGVVALLVQGLYEIVLFSYAHDLILSFLLAIMMRQDRDSEKAIP